MENYKVTYYFSKEFYVTQIVEAASKEAAMRDVKGEKVVRFEDSKGILYEFDMSDVKLITVSEFKQPRVIAKPF
ncbi:hypothetical protein [Anoxybacteroides tepidamans]|uniref:hypothetical protein n=1 Tax=Anoxybacteroides tepidamans TaxID=265948 RepID=UPI000483B807|nr:hypothetical protein [Anoxybacillus tepidamans]